MGGDKPLIMALDIGGTWLRVALSDAEANFLNRTTVFTSAEEGAQKGIKRIKETIRKTASVVDFAEIKGIAVAAAGPVDPQSGVILTPPNLPTWRNVPLKEILEQEFQIPVWVENDADMAALGEHRFGAGRGFDHLIYITVSTGIGGGIITGGRLLRGAKISAAEIGHIVLDPQGPRCNCGGRGCLEALASGTAIARKALERISRGETSLINDLIHGDLSKVTAEIVAQAAFKGDLVANQVIKEAATSLGLGVVNLIHLFDPEVVIIGGGVSKAGDLILEPVRQVIAERAMPDFKHRVKVVPSALGDNSGLFGAVAFAFEELKGAGAP